MDMHQYFPGSHPQLTDRLDAFLKAKASELFEVANKLDVVSLVLAGGYGRGEGGVFIDKNGEAQLYNDLEFYLFTNGRPSSRLRNWVEEVERQGSAELGIDVEIKLLSVHALESARPSMFMYDLVKGHAIVYGPKDFLSSDRFKPLGDQELIRLDDAAHLLFNRGSGLFFSAAKLTGVDPKFDSGFIQRNHAKLKLALGDAVLTVNGLYRSSCRERERLMTSTFEHKPPCWELVQRLHASGVLFKLNPRHENILREEMERQQRDLVELWTCVFLWIENRRLGESFKNLSEYGRYRHRLLPEFPACKNLALRLRDVLRYKEFLPIPLEYPRGVLQRSLSAFLRRQDSIDIAAGARILGVREENAFETYRRWWTRYN